MPVNRITRQLDLNNSDTVILVYGQVNDIFITEDLRKHDNDGIEKILALYLHEHGYDQIIFYSPERQLYTYDETSYSWCFPPKNEPEQGELVTQQTAGAAVRDKRPLGARKYLRPRQASRTNVAANNQNTNLWNLREGYIPVVKQSSDAAVVDIIRASLWRTEGKTAVILSQFDNPSNSAEVLRLLQPVINGLRRRHGDHKIFIITNAINQEKLKQQLDVIPALGSILAMNDEEKGLDSLLYIGYPQQDETSAIIHRQRVVQQKEVDWQQVSRIARALDLDRNTLKRWDITLRKMNKIDVTTLNQQKALSAPLSAEEEPPFKKLDALVGLSSIKQALRRFIRQLQDIREHSPEDRPLMHIMLKGNPGTGKTTIARLIAAILREYGLLQRGQLIEVDQARLVAGYVGQTAIATDNCCREALDGVLFIDEAYALMPRKERNAPAGGGGSQHFGQEAIDTLIKRMSDWQERFCVILAGYPAEMENLLEANPGFKGRIGLTLVIEDYTPEELHQIFNGKVNKAKLTATEEFDQLLGKLFTSIYRKRPKKFDNGRTVEQLFARINELRIDRCDRHQLDSRATTFEVTDIPADHRENALKITPEGDAMQELQAMIGLQKAKEQIRRQIATVVADAGQDPGNTEGRRLHLVLRGNPGTGKTTVARLVGRIYQHYQILRNNVFVEAGRDDLVGQYMGETAQKVTAKIEEAMGGILFIDEVYSLVNGDNDAYGKEAITILLKKMDDHRNDLCVIIAGYTGEMRTFMKSNPGLSRRFPTTIDFEDYDAEQLYHIFQSKLAKCKRTLAEGVDDKVKQIIQRLHHRKNQLFGNAGDMENFVQHIQEGHSVRCLDDKLSPQNTPIILTDIPQEYLKLLPVPNMRETIDEAIKELDALVGLAPVKKFVKELVDEYKHRQRRAQVHPELMGDHRNYNMLFMGNPGTGKTTVAKLMGRIFLALDILKQGEVFTRTRESFVGQYQGQTAPKTKELVESSFDNILFIDEAYSLFLDGGDTMGREAINALVPLMTEHRERLVVIAAGYPRELQFLMRANSGLSSRFPQENQVTFPDYTAKEMVQIAKHLLGKWKYELQDGLEKDLEDHLNLYKAKRGHEFGNARDVETWLNNIVLPKHRQRVAQLETTDALFSTIIKEDLPPKEDAAPQSKADNADNKSTGDFSPAREKKEQAQSTSSINNFGPGDVMINGNKITNNNTYYANTKESPKLLTDVPDAGGKIFGRDKDVENLFHKLIAPGTTKIVLFGIGGVGKTRAVVHLVNTYQHAFSHIIWLEVKTNLQKSFIENGVLIERLGIDFSQNDNDEARFASIITKINSLKSHVLLIVDGLPITDARELKRLSFSNTKILITSRQQLPGMESLQLDTLQRTPAIDLFTTIYPQETNHDTIDNLLRPVSYHPLAVGILAKILQTNPNMTFDRLLQHIDGLLITTGEIDITYREGGEADEKVIEIFKALFNLVDLSEEEIGCLICFSVLPDRPISRRLVYDLLLLEDDEQKDRFNNVIITLQRKGFISSDSTLGIFCHQIIQQVCRNQYPPTLENCGRLFTTLGTNLGQKIERLLFGKSIFALITDYLNLLETFITHFDESDLFDNRIYLNLSQLYRISGQFTQSLAASLKEKAALEQIRDQFPLWYSLINFNIGITQSMMGEYLDAEKVFEETVNFIEELDLNDQPDKSLLQNLLISSWSQLGNIQMRAGKNDVNRAIVCFEAALKTEKNCEEPESLTSATLKEGLALAQIQQGNHEDAIANLKDAQALLIEKEGMERDSLVINLLDVTLAQAYAGDNNFSQARFYSSRAVENIGNHLPEDDIQCYAVYFTAGILDLQQGLNKLNATDEVDQDLFGKAANNFAKAIKIVETHRGKDHEDLFLVYSNYAMALKFSNRAEEGYAIQQKSLDICRKMPVKNLLMMSIFFRTIFYFGNQLEEKEDAEKYLHDCLAILPDKPDHYLDIAFVNHILGDYLSRYNRNREAITAHMKALEFVQKVFVKDRENPDNDSPLEVMCLQAIAQCYSGLHEHLPAIKNQKQAVLLCEKHMDADDKELAEPYTILANIFLAAAVDEQVASESMEYYALSLEYKIKAEKLDIKLIQCNPQLDESGRLYQVLTKNEKGETRKQLIIIPYKHYTRFETGYAAGMIDNLGQYGHILTELKGMRREEIIDHYVEKYGPLTDKTIKMN